VVAGSADRIVAPSAARALAGQIPGAELVQLSGATHLLPQQRPVELAGVILAAAGAG
jgi:pimeloyl-ACP methyl ester carboxylesterase